MLSKIWQLHVLCLRLWRWWTTLDNEMLNFPDTFQMIHADFTVEVLETRAKFLESSVYGYVINCSFTLHDKCFWLFSQHYGPVWICKAQVYKLDYVVHLFVWCNGKSAGLWPQSKQIWTPIILLHLLSNQYLWERHEPSHLPSYGLNSITAVLLQG